MKETKDLQWALDHSHTYGLDIYPDVFDANIGMDFHLDEHPDWYPKIAGWRDKRTVVIEITSFRGMCWNAIHYYAKLKADGVNICSDEIGSDGEIKSVSHAGYLGEEYKSLPKEKQSIWNSRYEIEIVRPVTQEEIDSDPDRWYGYDAGWPTNGFENKSELIKTAKKVAELRFPEGWDIIVEDNS
jgi:hypothetical protein